MAGPYWEVCDKQDASYAVPCGVHYYALIRHNFSDDWEFCHNCAGDSPDYEIGMNTKKFMDYSECQETGTLKFNQNAWKSYWDGLSQEEKNSLRQKAQWEHMSLSAVAIEWGASVSN